MKPFPKWIGWLGAIAAAAPSLYVAYQIGGWKGLVLAILGGGGAGVTLNSHSATGTGGEPPK